MGRQAEQSVCFKQTVLTKAYCLHNVTLAYGSSIPAVQCSCTCLTCRFAYCTYQLAVHSGHPVKTHNLSGEHSFRQTLFHNTYAA